MCSFDMEFLHTKVLVAETIEVEVDRLFGGRLEPSFEGLSRLNLKKLLKLARQDF